jgi:hypothetical protein
VCLVNRSAPDPGVEANSQESGVAVSVLGIAVGAAVAGGLLQQAHALYSCLSLYQL